MRATVLSIIDSGPHSTATLHAMGGDSPYAEVSVLVVSNSPSPLAVDEVYNITISKVPDAD